MYCYVHGESEKDPHGETLPEPRDLIKNPYNENELEEVEADDYAKAAGEQSVGHNRWLGRKFENSKYQWLPAGNTLDTASL